MTTLYVPPDIEDAARAWGANCVNAWIEAAPAAGGKA